MSAIEFVVRGDAGVVERGSVAGAGGDASIIVGAGQDISLNLSRSHILSYVRQGQALQVTLVDGQTITIQGFFSADGVAENELFISANSELAQVDLVAGEGNLLYAQYVDADAFGKWSPDDELYFVRGSEVQIAGVEAVDGEAGMLFAPLLGGLGGLVPALGAGAAAVVGAAALTAAGKGDDKDEPADPKPVDPDTVDPEPVDPDPVDPNPVDPNPAGPDPVDPEVPLEVNITSGTQGVGHVVNGDDYDNGIDIGGTGTPGATGVITVGEVSQNVEVDGQGSWTASFNEGELPEGDYISDVSVTLTDGDRTATATDSLDVDTVVNVSVNVDAVEGDGIVSFDEERDGITLTGSTDVNTTVVVTIDEVDYEAEVTGGNWTLELDGGVIEQGQYDLEVNVTATDEYGNTGTATDFVAIDTVTSVTLVTSAAGGDGTVNRDEHADGVAVSGMAEANASVEVSLGNFATQTVQANAQGEWSYTFASGVVPTGTTDVTVAAVSTDAVGNEATATGTVKIDTDLDVGIDTSGVAGDGTVNILEHARGVTLTGTADAGAEVTVVFGTGTRVTYADVNGNWTDNWTATEVPTGQTDAPVSVTARDNAGNVSYTNATVNIDTVIDATINTDGIGGNDSVINFVEHPDGVTMTGTAVGADRVSVNFGGVVHGPVDVNADGSWSSFYTAAEYTTGEESVRVTVTAVDDAGNRDTDFAMIEIDTFVNRLDSAPGMVEGNDVVNRDEASNGITLNGVVEEGSRVFVTLEGHEEEAIVDANGNWSVTFKAENIPVMDDVTEVNIRAVDEAGNEAEITDTFRIDTEVPDAADIISVIDASTVTRGFTMVNVETGETVEVSDFVNGSDTAQGVDGVSGVNSLSGELEHLFASGAEVPDGSHLVVTNADVAGNTNSTLLVLDEDDTSVVDITAGALDGFNIGAIDLEFAADSDLTLSVADFEGLSMNDNSLVVHGGTDDKLTLTDGVTTPTNETREINGQTYDVYQVGANGGELIINEEIDLFYPGSSVI